MIELFVSFIAVMVSAVILKYHGEPRYRFAAAVLSVGGWTMAAGVALPEQWRCHQLNQAIRQLAAQESSSVSTTHEVTLVGITPGGNIVEVRKDGVRIRANGSEQRGTISRWGGFSVGSGDGSVFTGSATPVRGITGSRGM